MKYKLEEFKSAFLVFVLVFALHPSGGNAQELSSMAAFDFQSVEEAVFRPGHGSTAFEWEPATSVFIEFLGKGWYSLNADFRKKPESSVSVGIQVVEEIWPNIMYYRFFGKRYRFETGLGISGIISFKTGFDGMSVHGVLGYRYQKKKGLLFRAGFTPIAGIPFREGKKLTVIPFPGLSLGYSF